MLLALNIGSRVLTTVICGAIAILVLSQLRKDGKSRAFAWVMLNVAGLSFSGTLSRFFGLVGSNPEAILLFFNVSVILTSALSLSLTNFSNDLYANSSRWRRWLIYWFAAVQMPLTILLAFQGKLNYNVHITPDAFVIYDRTTASNVLLGHGLLLTMSAALPPILTHLIRRKSEEPVSLVIGSLLITCAPLSFIIPPANTYSGEQFVYALGSLLMVGPLLGQRLFDPLTQLNVKLAHRAEQFAILTRVGQQATSFLKQDELLSVIVKEIQQAFRYYAVAIHLPDSTNNVIAMKAIATKQGNPASADFQLDMNSNSLIGVATASEQTVYAPDVLNDKRYIPHAFFSATRSEICLPLIIGSALSQERKLIGVLDVQGDRVNQFTPEDQELLSILANQIAIAIRNAQLFEEAQRARQVADEANRQKSKFLSEMSHELRTPLQTIVAYSKWMLHHPEMYNGATLPDVYQSDVARIEQSSQHLHSLINGILDLSKIEAGELNLEMDSVDPLPILQEVQKTYTPSLLQGVQIQARYPDHLPCILGDDLRIKQILGNLVSNACKFTAQGTIILDAEAKDGKLRFAVADTGPGISIEEQAMLFTKPYAQVNKEIGRKYGGTGLGLHICGQLVTLHGGEIGCESAEGKGATFYFTIPLAAEKPATVPHQLASRVVIFSRREKKLPAQVLIVDARSDTREKLELALRDVGYAVIPTASASQGAILGPLAALKAIIVVIHPDSATEMLELPAVLNKNDSLKGIYLIESKVLSDTPGWLKELLGQLSRTDRLGVIAAPV